MFENIMMNAVLRNLEAFILCKGAKKEAMNWIFSSTRCLKLNIDTST